jgi:hypothetical protein
MFNINQLLKLSIILGSFLMHNSIFSQSNIHSNDTDQELIIPVVFHVVYNNAIPEFSNNDILDVLLKINQGFNEVDITKIDPHYRQIIANCNIKFVLAKKDKDKKNINPITWHQTDTQKFNDLDFFSRKKLMSYGFLSDDDYLNIWIADFGERVGFGIYPVGYWRQKLRKDGVAINHTLVRNKFIPPIIHEIGHYLNLAHVWEERMGNDENDTSCDNDDGILDTPRQAGPNKFFGGDAGGDDVFQFNEIEKVCGDPTTAGNYQNFMDYAYQINSMFTEGQKNSMRNAIFTYRKGLLQYDKITETSILALTKQRDKLGASFNFNQRLPYNTNIDLTLKAFFEKELGILYTTENLQRLGLKIIGTDKFEDLATNKIITQDYIYKYLHTEKAKDLLMNGHKIEAPQQFTSERKTFTTTYWLWIQNPNNEKRKIVFINQNNSEEYSVNVPPFKMIRGQPQSTSIGLPLGKYKFNVYGSYSNDIIESSNIQITKDNQKIILEKYK